MDYLSRLEFDESDDEVRDEFPDAQLFKIIVEAVADESVLMEDKCIIEMHQFLGSGLPPDEEKQLAV